MPNADPVHHRRLLDEQENAALPLPPPRPSRYLPVSRSLFSSLLFSLTIGDNQGPQPVSGRTASLIRTNYAERLKRFNCPTRRTPRSRTERLFASLREKGGVIPVKWRQRAPLGFFVVIVTRQSIFYGESDAKTGRAKGSRSSLFGRRR